jgi:L-seryl-tRNA(Ser) seleniumtransferase
MIRSGLQAIPSVEKVMLALGDAGLPRPTAVAAVRRELAALRAEKTIPDFKTVLSRVSSALNMLRASRIQPIINGTGILVHTNFGRAPLGTTVIEAMVKVAGHYNNLEYDVPGGARGGRAAYLDHNLALLCAAQAATVVNNNAAALVLILRHFCGTRDKKNEVVISRGELIQIGGGFRIPEILESSDARLREVGTTNSTSLADYARAITPATAMILKVHRSNFFMSGFVDSPSTEEIAALAHKKGIPFVEDLGSGAVIETKSIAGLEHEPTPAEVLRRGVDLVCFSGDKLFGGPQAGIVAGKSKLIAALKREPFFRALRCDKLILSGLEATVDIYLAGKASKSPADKTSGIPLIEMLQVSTDELRSRAERIIALLDGAPLNATIGPGQAQIGGGALPQSMIPSITVDLAHDTLPAQEMAARLRGYSLPVIGYIKSGKLRLDLRTIFPGQDAELVNAIRAVF